MNCKKTLNPLEHVEQFEYNIHTNSLKETIRYRNCIAKQHVFAMRTQKGLLKQETSDK